MTTCKTTFDFKNILTIFILLCCFGISFHSLGQQQNLNENDVIAKAKTLFEKKDYQNALPLYAQLVSVHPENAEYNFCLGVCTLFGDRKDKKKPIRYLNNAAPSMKDNAELNYYLGLAYHQNQEFANAMKYYNLYLSKLTSGAPERALILEKINACLNGLNLIDKNLVSEQISKSNFQKDNFHRGYAAEDLPGSLVIKPDLFQSEKDKKSGEINFVFITQPDNVLLFSGYSGSGVDNKDIYIVVKQAAGEWGTPEKLDETINTSYDENYPVLADDGNTLYFCSKGHNSLGGYDIYRSKFDQTEKKFGQPENLGPGINSPFDDVLFIPAIEKEFAWFSSDRDNLNGSISVFKVRLTDNPFHEKTLLADNSGTGNDTPSENAGMVKSDNKEPEVKNNISENRSEASKKGMNIMNDRAKSAALTDSVFTIIANTKDLIRELTNRRDRANAISQRKSSEAKELELRFESEIAALALIQNKEQFEHDLEKTVKLKEEIMQLNQRADQANKIAWILGNQIKLKNEELVVLKNTAAKIQTSSLSGTYEETLVLYTEFVNHTETSDTLADFSTQLVSITNNEVKYKIPEGEFVFADKLKKAFSDNTLLAELNNQKQTIKKDIPIVVVDKTSGAQNTKTIQNLAAKNTLVAFALVEPVTFQEKDLITSLLSAEQLVIRFTQDNTMKPYTLVQPVLYNTIAFNTMPPDVNLEINFNSDMISANDIKPVVQQVAFNNSKYNTLPDESDIELRFTADQVNPAKLVQPVIANMNDFNAIAQSENLEINFEADKPVGMEAFQLVQPVFVHDLASSDFVNDEMLEINFNTDRSPINDIGQIIDPVYASFNFNTLPDISALEINFLNDQVTPFKITEPVYANFAYRNPTENEEIEINFNNDKTEAILIAGNIEPVTIMNSSDANAVREENLETGFEIDQREPVQAIALVEPVISGYDSFGFQPDEPDLEISYTADEVNPVRIVQQVAMNYDPGVGFSGTEDIEIRFSGEETTVEVNPMETEPVYIQESEKQVIADNESLEITYTVDAAGSIKPVEPVIFNETELALYENILEIRFNVDEEKFGEITLNENSNEIATGIEMKNLSETVASGIHIYELVVPVPNNYLAAISLPAEELLEIGPDAEKSPVIPELINPIAYSFEPASYWRADEEIEITFSNDKSPFGAFYLRASVLQSKTIETSISDMELLERALKNPDELTYEELLFAAGLAVKPADKLSIYNAAFVHVDRDWRAYNNASVSAIQSENLSQADCYLFQASLLSSDNPQIKNNMGILACHEKNYTKAEEFFIAASSLSHDAEYNLQVVNNMEKSFQNKGKGTDMTDHDSQNDIIVEIVEYQPGIY